MQSTSLEVGITLGSIAGVLLGVCLLFVCIKKCVLALRERECKEDWIDMQEVEFGLAQRLFGAGDCWGRCCVCMGVYGGDGERGKMGYRIWRHGKKQQESENKKEVKHKQKEMVRITDCNKLIHSKCLQKWLQSNKTCPICRKSLLKTPYDGYQNHRNTQKFEQKFSFFTKAAAKTLQIVKQKHHLLKQLKLSPQQMQLLLSYTSQKQVTLEQLQALTKCALIADSHKLSTSFGYRSEESSFSYLALTEANLQPNLMKQRVEPGDGKKKKHHMVLKGKKYVSPVARLGYLGDIDGKLNDSGFII